MIINKCDICGMTEGLRYLNDKDQKCVATFSCKPLIINKKNYKGEDYTVFVNVVVEKDSDSKKMQDAYNKMQMNGMDTDVMQGLMMQIMGGGQRRPNVHLDNPYPSLCDACKTKILMTELMK